jgi:hypothetical protein
MATPLPGRAMRDYLRVLRVAGHPMGVRDLAIRTGRDHFRTSWQYAPAERLVRAGLAQWVPDPRRADWRRLTAGAMAPERSA